MTAVEQMRLARDRWKGRKGPIGLDFGDRELRAVQLQTDPEGLHLLAAVTAPYPMPRDQLIESSGLKKFVTGTLRRGGFRGRRAVAILDNADVKLMVVDYRDAETDDEASRILELAGERIRQPLAELVVDYLRIRTSGDRHGGRSALVAVAQRASAIARLERLHAAGIDVAALEIAPVAIQRLVSRARPRADETSVVIVAGAMRSALLVFWGRRLLHYHDLEFGSSVAIESISKALDVSLEAAEEMLEEHGVTVTEGGEIARAHRDILKPALYQLSEDIRRAAIYTASKTQGASFEKLIVLGAPNQWPGVSDFLGGLVGIPIDRLDPARLLGSGDGPLSVTGSDLQLATGLAMRGSHDAD